MYSVKLKLQDTNSNEYDVNINSASYYDMDIKAFANKYKLFTDDTLISVQKRGDYEDVDIE